MFAVAATLRKQAFCDYYVSANQAIFFHTRSGGKMAKFQCQLMRQTLSRTRIGEGNREVSVSADTAIAVMDTEQPEKQQRLSVCRSTNARACWTLCGVRTSREGDAPRSNRKLAGRCTGP